MSWIRVKKDNIELLVSTESYKDLFSKQGYSIIENDNSPTQIIPKEKPNIEVKSKESIKEASNGQQQNKNKSNIKNKE